MKKLSLLLALATIGVMSIQYSNIKINAAGVPDAAGISLTSSSLSIEADGVSTATVSLAPYHYVCNSVSTQTGENLTQSTAEDCDSFGDGVKSIEQGMTPSGHAGTYNINIGHSGVASLSTSQLPCCNGSFTVSSNTPGTVALTPAIVFSKNGEDASFAGEVNSLVLTFTEPTPAPEPEPEPTAPAPTPAAQTQTNDAPTVDNPSINTAVEQPTVANTASDANDKPPTPSAKLVDAEGNEQANVDEKIEYRKDEPIVINGKTIPNGEVKLFIFSEPQEATVTADENGDWSYTIANIESGDHRLEIEVTDPETGETSDREEVLQFAVLGDEDSITDVAVKSVNEAEEKSSSLWLIIGLPVMIIAGLLSAGFLLHKKKVVSPIQTQSSTDN